MGDLPQYGLVKGLDFNKRPKTPKSHSTQNDRFIQAVRLLWPEHPWVSLSRETGINYNTIKSWVAGQSPAPPDALHAVADLLQARAALASQISANLRRYADEVKAENRKGVRHYNITKDTPRIGSRTARRDELMVEVRD